MWYIIVSNYIYSSLLEILVNIINYKHYLIINAKFQSSTINNEHTMSLVDMLVAPQVIWQAALQSITSKFTTMNIYY